MGLQKKWYPISLPIIKDRPSALQDDSLYSSFSSEYERAVFICEVCKVLNLEWQPYQTCNYMRHNWPLLTTSWNTSMNVRLWECIILVWYPEEPRVFGRNRWNPVDSRGRMASFTLLHCKSEAWTVFSLGEHLFFSCKTLCWVRITESKYI
jgi:hypothetical protein